MMEHDSRRTSSSSPIHRRILIYLSATVLATAALVAFALSAATFASQALLGSLLLLVIVVLGFVAMDAVTWARNLTSSIQRLTQATERIAEGNFGVRVDASPRDDLGVLAASVNTMAQSLKIRENALVESQYRRNRSDKMSAFGQLGTGIAHEVKNPLAGILGCAQLSLMEVDADSLIHQNLVLIEQETERCKQIIDNLLKFSRQDATLMELTEINLIVQDAAAIVRQQIENEQVTLELDLDDSIPQIHGNSNQLQQMMINLLLNAQQAMEGKPGTITASTRLADDGALEIRVGDDGAGMTDEVKEKLFEPFFTTRPTGRGTGLGLSVAYGIIHDHSGDVSVTSEPGHGSEFLIRMPVMQMDAMPHLELGASLSNREPNAR